MIGSFGEFVDVHGIWLDEGNCSFEKFTRGAGLFAEVDKNPLAGDLGGYRSGADGACRGRRACRRLPGKKGAVCPPPAASPESCKAQVNGKRASVADSIFIWGGRLRGVAQCRARGAVLELGEDASAGFQRARFAVCVWACDHEGTGPTSPSLQASLVRFRLGLSGKWASSRSQSSSKRVGPLSVACGSPFRRNRDFRGVSGRRGGLGGGS